MRDWNINWSQIRKDLAVAAMVVFVVGVVLVSLGSTVDYLIARALERGYYQGVSDQLAGQARYGLVAHKDGTVTLEKRDNKSGTQR